MITYKSLSPRQVQSGNSLGRERDSMLDGQETPTTFRSSPTTYDPSRSHLRPSNLHVRSAATSLTGQPRTRKGHTYDPQTRLSAQREAVGESWKCQTCKRHIKDKTLEETRSPETPFGRQPGIQRSVGRQDILRKILTPSNT